MQKQKLTKDQFINKLVQKCRVPEVKYLLLKREFEFIKETFYNIYEVTREELKNENS